VVGSGGSEFQEEGEEKNVLDGMRALVEEDLRRKTGRRRSGHHELFAPVPESISEKGVREQTGDVNGEEEKGGAWRGDQIEKKAWGRTTTEAVGMGGPEIRSGGETELPSGGLRVFGGVEGSLVRHLKGRRACNLSISSVSVEGIGVGGGGVWGKVKHDEMRGSQEGRGRRMREGNGVGKMVRRSCDRDRTSLPEVGWKKKMD